jgi:hypothetical protein
MRSPPSSSPRRPPSSSSSSSSKRKGGNVQDIGDEENLNKKKKQKSRVVNDEAAEEEAKESEEEMEQNEVVAAIPKRNSKGEFVFKDFPDFRPNLSPEEIIRAGSFGGTYFRPIYSEVTNRSYTSEEAMEGLPAEWFEGLDVASMVTSTTYHTNINKYKAKCGQGLREWESSGWITAHDPYGWFQWYCHFYLGRRCPDDERQVKRGMGVMGRNGRWRRFLVNKCLQANKPSLQDALEDVRNISPKVRQLLLHWGYDLTLENLIDAVK